MKQSHSFWKLASIAVVCLLSLNFAWGAATVTVTPVTSSWTVGSTYTVNVNVAGITNLQASHVRLNFNHNEMQYSVAAANGGFFSGGDFFASLPSPGPTADSVVVDQAVIGAPLNGGGTLFTLQFTAISAGSRTIGVSVTMRDPLNQTITTTATGATVTISNLVPTTSSISPTTKNAGDPGFALTVNGTNFVGSSVVRFNGSDRTTTFVSATQLTAAITTADLVTGGLKNITVFNPTPGGGVSNGQILTVNHIITASAGPNGLISPLGAVPVVPGGGQTFTITPDLHYHVADVLVDGGSVGPVTSYPFTAVAANHTIAASFAIDTYAITVTQSAHGTISPGTTSVNHGSSQTFTITPDPGYSIATLTVDGSPVTPAGSYTFTSVTAPHTITATYTINTYTITVTQTPHGTISPGTTLVNWGSNQTFTITPDPGYSIATLTVDGSPVTPAGTYTFTNVTAPHTITATYTINTYTITVTQTPHGSISPGTTVVNWGSDQTFTITPDVGYSIATLTVDGSPVTPAGSYTFTNVTTTHTITATYVLDTYTITPSAGANGSISPNTPQSVNYGGTPTFTMTGASNYHLGALLIDGSPVNPVSPYTFAPVSANHTIHARFAQTQYTIDHIGLYSFDTNGDGTNDMSMNFTVLPNGGGTVSIYVYFAAPPAEQPGPAGSLGYYVIIVCSMPAHSFSVTVKSDMADVASFGATSNLVYYHSVAPTGWVLMPATYAASDPDFSNHKSLSFTTDHFSNFTLFNAPSKNMYVSLGGATAAAGTVYPNNGWTGSIYGADDWQWTGTQALSFYLVPELNSVFKEGNVTLEWDNTVMTYAGIEWTGLSFATHTPTQTGNQLQLQVSNAGDITVNPLNYIAKINFTLLRPGHSALAVVQSSFSKLDLSEVNMIPHQGEVKAYLADVANSSVFTSGDGRIDFNDLVPWSISYWSGVPGFPGGMANYKKKFDIGPTQNGYIFTLPVTDSKIEFEDLLIFSISYGQTAANQLPKLPAPSNDPVEVSLGKPVASGSETRIPVMIAGGVTDVRGMSIQVEGAFGSFLGAEKGELLNAYETPVMVMARAEGRSVFVDLAVMGLQAPGIGRSGDVVWLRFTGRPMVTLAGTAARNSLNADLNVQKKKGEGEAVPATYALQQNYPNPFNPTTTIEYAIPAAGRVTLEVYNMLGERVASLVDDVQEAGFYRVGWDGRDNNGGTVATGVYLYRVKSGDFSSVRKLLLLK